MDRGTYTYESQHPPLTRIFLPRAPYRRGVRSNGQTNIVKEEKAILGTRGDSWNTLAAPRTRALPFYILGCLVVLLWAAGWFGQSAAWWHLLPFNSLPPILAYGSFATTDMGAAATALFALYVLMRW